MTLFNNFKIKFKMKLMIKIRTPFLEIKDKINKPLHLQKLKYNNMILCKKFNFRKIVYYIGNVINKNFLF